VKVKSLFVGDRKWRIGPYTGARSTQPSTPVSLLGSVDVQNGRHISEWKSQNIKKREKTLG